MNTFLLPNNCLFDCSYCPNSWKEGVSITPEELSGAFFSLREQGVINGTFISSAVNGDSENVMERIIKAGEMIRKDFGGYIHLKVMPGSSREQIKRALEVANRVSINVETTSQSRMGELSYVKDLKNDIGRRITESSGLQDFTILLLHPLKARQIKEILVDGTLPDKDPKTLICRTEENGV
ncbi:MAG TPA: hypothetical protein EYP30_01205 [Archaeoglobaceae archaeon]|nr:hypothetical protein [Archaeoglobaceae archaeon]